MLKAIGRFLNKVSTNIQKAAKAVMGIPDNAKVVNVRKYINDSGETIYERIEEHDAFVDAATDWSAMKLVSVIVAAAGVFFISWPLSPELAPVLATIGGVLVKVASSMWREEWNQKISPI